MIQKDSPASGRVERRKEETKEKIVTIAIRLFHEQGIDGTTMEQIAAEVDIAKGTLYNYFPVKEAILVEWIKRSFREKGAERGQALLALPDTRERLSHMLGDLVDGVLRQQVLFERFLIYRVQNIVSLKKTEADRSGLDNLAGTIIRLGQERGELRVDLPAWMLEEMFEFILIETVKQLSGGDDPVRRSQIIQQSVDLFMTGARQAP